LVISADVLKQMKMKDNDEHDKDESGITSKREGLLLVQQIQNVQLSNIIEKNETQNGNCKKKLSITYVL